MNNRVPPPEFSRIVQVGHLRDGESRSLRIVCEGPEREELAARFGMRQLVELKSDIAMIRRGPQIIARVQFTADVIQDCVVSLEPVPAHISDAVTVTFDPETDPHGEGPAFIDPLAEDPPEPLIDEAIDFGEIVAERLGLELEPYPRKPGAELDPKYAATNDPGEEDASPFARLRALKLES